MTNEFSLEMLIRFWAKTTHDKDRYPNAYHPLICHMIDVAVVTLVMWEEVLPKAAKKRIARALGLPTDKAGLELVGRIVAWIAGLHDLGKASPPFTLRYTLQNLQKMYDATPFSASRLLRLPAPLEAPHGYVTASELPDILQTDFGLPAAVAERIGVMIGGHHGVFPRSLQLNEIHQGESFKGNWHWQQARRALASELAKLFNLLSLPAISSLALQDNAATMLLAGLVSVSDWIGSNSTFFKCEVKDSRNPPAINLKEYFAKAMRQAREALSELRWLNWPAPADPAKFEDLFPKLKGKLRDLQSASVALAEQLTTAGIVIVEAPMGEGKTEAAIFLADHWNASLKQRGCYFALPTQATSNQMFGRVRDYLAGRYADSRVLLQLLHGHAALSAEFETLLKEGEKPNRAMQLEGVHDEQINQGDCCAANVAAAEWFTYRKRGLLAPFGVGTVDQALMAALQTKHVFVRLFGLAHKTVIIDEVHAYDAYMSALLERLLSWLAALRSPVVLLSATLPKKRRDALIKAYQSGLGESHTVSANGTEDRYPRITWSTELAGGVRRLKTSEQNSRSFNLRLVDGDIPKLAEQLQDALKEGGCAAVICNTVRRAQEVYEALKPFFPGEADDGLPALDLLHARYLFKDRADRETRTLTRFGKSESEVTDRDGRTHKVRRPKCAVLVSTQIIEQSLDLDFDLMVTELAPVDLMLQRAGRLHRHQRDESERPPNLRQPQLWIGAPEIGDDGLLDFGVNKLVYDEHILLRSWLEVKDGKPIAIPDNIEDLIEAVYNADRDCPQESLTAHWQETKGKMLKKLQKKEAKAKPVRILPPWDEELLEDFNRELDEDNPEKHKSLQALTRDDETPSVSVIFLTQEESCHVPLKQKLHLSAARFLLERSVSINNYGAVEALLDKDREDTTPAAWRDYAMLRHYKLVIVDAEGKQRIKDHLFRVHPELGIVINNL
jgi:CRISPR-associated endonuclease/helicase Cas3